MGRRPLLPLLPLLSARLSSCGSGGGEREVLRWLDPSPPFGGQPPHARGGAAIARFRYGANDWIFLYGGCGEVACYDELSLLDLSQSKWRPSPGSPASGKSAGKRRGATSVGIGQRVFVWGGWAGDGPTAGLKAFDVMGARWEAPPTSGTPPSPRWGHTATFIGGQKMLVFGGEGMVPGDYRGDAFVFDAGSETWRELPLASHLSPPPRLGHSACLIQSSLFVFGGYGMEARGSRLHRAARNDVWLLDLKGGVEGARGWVYVQTIGQPPAARGFHAAVASEGGGNMFVTGGCDEVEGECFNDVHMLDTEYPEGMRWRALPVGMQRFQPRHQFAAWVSSSRLMLHGGCSPLSEGGDKEEHCFSDLWYLELGDLAKGGKSFNITSDGTKVHSLAPAHEAQRIQHDSATPASQPAHAAATTSHPSSLPLPRPSNGVSLSETDSENEGSYNANITSLSFHPSQVEVSAASPTTIHSSSPPSDEEEECALPSLTSCERTGLAAMAAALTTSLSVTDHSKLGMGRFIRINPGGLNQEDAKIVGFGSQPYWAGATAGLRSEDTSYTLNNNNNNSKNNRAGSSRRNLMLLQLQGRALMPPSRASSWQGVGRHSSVELMQVGREAVEGRAVYLSQLSRAPARWLNLSSATKFAHAAGEVVVQLPKSTRAIAPAPGLQHLRRPNHVHSQQVEPASLYSVHKTASHPPSSSPASSSASPPPHKRTAFVRPEDDDAGEEASDSDGEGGWRAQTSQPMQLFAKASERMAYHAAEGPKLWWWFLVLVGLPLLVCILVLILLRIRARRHRKDTQLEDVHRSSQPMTWRKGV